MEVDFHGEIDNRLSPSGIQKVQEDLSKEGVDIGDWKEFKTDD